MPSTPSLDFVTLDVFTHRRFGGNPLAVVFDPDARLDTASMQAIAREFNLSETTFVRPPADPAHDAQVRIFTPATEMPWAGHPNVGTAWALALRTGSFNGSRTWRFEEGAGVVRVQVESESGAPVVSRVRAPAPLQVARGRWSLEAAARCIGLQAQDLVDEAGGPPIASVGFPFPMVEVKTREALRRARPDAGAMAASLPALGLDGVVLWCRETDAGDGEPHGSDAAAGVDLSVRMFAPLIGVVEDPATGAGVAALAALRATSDPAPRAAADGTLRMRVSQGIDMGRPSALSTLVQFRDGQALEVSVGGACVPVLEGRLRTGVR